MKWTWDLHHVSIARDSSVVVLSLCAGLVETLAGDGTGAFADGVGTNAKFNYPSDVAVSPDGLKLYVTEYVSKAS